MITPDASVLRVMAKLPHKSQNVLRRNAGMPELKTRVTRALRAVVLLSDADRKTLMEELGRLVAMCCGEADCRCTNPLDRCTFLDE